MSEIHLDRHSLEFIRTSRNATDVLHRFAKPALTFILQNTLSNKTWAQKVDKEVKKAVKTAFKLPRRTASASLYAPPHSGGMGIPASKTK